MGLQASLHFPKFSFIFMQVALTVIDMLALGRGFSFQSGRMTQPVLNFSFGTPMNIPTGDFPGAIRLPSWAHLSPVFLNYSTTSHEKPITGFAFFNRYWSSFASNPQLAAGIDVSSAGALPLGPSMTGNMPVSFERQKAFGETLHGVQFKGINEGTTLTANYRSTVVGHVEVDPNEDLVKLLRPAVRKALTSIDENCAKFGPKNEILKLLTTQFYRQYGEFVTTSMFLGNYTLELESTSNIALVSADQTHSVIEESRGTKWRVGPVSLGDSSKHRRESEITAPVTVQNVADRRSRLEFGTTHQPGFFMKDTTPTYLGSSFVPFSGLVAFDFPHAARALEYWMYRWNSRPTNLAQYLHANDLSSVAPGTKIQLWMDDFAYEVIVEAGNHLRMEQGRVEEHYFELQSWNAVVDKRETKPLFINPDDRSIYGFDATRAFTRMQKTHSRQFNVWGREITVSLDALWTFRDPTVAPHVICPWPELFHLTESPKEFFLKMEGISFSGRQFDRGPFSPQMQRQIHIKPANVHNPRQ